MFGTSQFLSKALAVPGWQIRLESGLTAIAARTVWIGYLRHGDFATYPMSREKDYNMDLNLETMIDAAGIIEIPLGAKT